MQLKPDNRISGPPQISKFERDASMSGLIPSVFRYLYLSSAVIIINNYSMALWQSNMGQTTTTLLSISWTDASFFALLSMGCAHSILCLWDFSN